MGYKLQDLIDMEHFQNLQDRLNEIYSFPSAIIDNDGNILTATAWQDICTKFHRKNKKCEKDCIKSDQYILSHLHEAKPAVSYRCPRGLVDNATPIIIDGVHYGNFFTGQFFLEKPEMEFYKTQAKKYGFDEEAYLAAVKKVPVWTQEQLNSYLFFIKGLITVISESGLKKLKEIETRKQMEESEGRFQTITENISETILHCDRSGRILYVNHLVPGLIREQVLTSTVYDFVPLEQRPVVEKAILDVFERGVSSKYESFGPGSNGEWRTYDVSVSPVMAGDRVNSAVFLASDITERKRAEEDLLKSEMALNRAQRVAQVGSWEWNIKTNRLEWSEEMFRIFGIVKGSFTGDLTEIVARAIHPDDRAKVERSNLSVIEKGRPIPLEYRVIWPDGTCRTVWAEAGELICDAQGKPAVLTGIAQDITDRKMAEQALRENEQRLVSIYNTVGDVIFHLAVEPAGQFRFVSVNPAFLKVTGLSLDTVVGKTVNEVIPEPSLTMVLGKYRQAIEENSIVHWEETTDYSTGRLIGEVSIAPVFDYNGTCTHLVGSVHDITERKQVEEALRESEKNYRQLFELESDALFLIDNQTGRILDANHAASLLYGFGHEELLFMKNRDLSAEPEETQRVTQGTPVVIDNLITIPLRWHRRKDGARFPVEITGRFFERDGRPVHIAAIRDITDRKKAEEELREKDKDLLIAQRLSNVGSWKWIASTDTVQWSEELCRINGHDPKLPAPRFSEMSSFYTPESWKRLNDAVEKALHNGESYELNLDLVRKDGIIRNTISRGEADYDVSGKVVGLHGTVQDITERKRVDEALRESEEKYRNLIEHSIEGIGISQGNRVIFANRTLLDMFGYDTVEEWARIPLIDHVAPESKSLIMERLHKRERGEFLEPRYEYKIIRKDGMKRDLEISTHEVSIQGEKYVQSTFRDITENKRADEALRESEERYRRLFEYSNDAIFIHNEKGRMLDVNQQAVDMLGYTREELIALPALDYHPPEVVDAAKTAFNVLLKAGHVRFDTKFRKKDGAVIDVEISVRPIKPGAAVFQALVRDITDRKQAEKALVEAALDSQQKAEFLRTIIDSLAHPFYVINTKDYTIQLANKFMNEHFHYKNLTTCFALTHRRDTPCDGSEYACPLDLVKRSGRPVVLEHVHIDGDGNPINMEIYAYPVFDSQGNISQMIEYSLDITERKKAEAALRESEERYRSILATTADGFVLMDINGKLIEVNEAYARMIGYSVNELLSMSIADIEVLEGMEKIEEHTKLIHSRGFDRFETRHRRKDGQIINVEVSVTAAQGGEGFITFIHDHTEKKRLEEQFFQAQKMELVGRLAGGVAHDFNNILTVINGTSEIALMFMDPANPYRESFQEILKSGNRAADLTRQLLAFSRKQIIVPQVINLNKILADMDKMFRRLIGEHIELVTIPDEGLQMVKADPGQIEQVLTNLVVNACDAMPDGGKLTIETRNADLDRGFTQSHEDMAPGRYIMFSVSDTGVGISGDVLPHIFEPFFTTKPVGSGTGLGLSTCYGIVKQNNGGIFVYSEPGRGSTFKVYFPAIDDTPDSKKTEKPLPSFPGGSETLLLVEDDESIRTMIKRNLSAAGYRVHEARNGEEALELAGNHRNPIDLLVTDLIMPIMGGKELAEQLVSLCPGIKVLFMSGYTDDTISHHGLVDRRIVFIQKPFSISDFMGKVREVLDSR